jgi:hypothetical protein
VVIVKKVLENHYLHAFLIFSILTVLFTYPVAFNMRTSFYGYPGDVFGAIWYLWWIKYAILDLGVSPIYTEMIGAPEGIYLPLFTPAIPLLSIPLTYLVDEVFAYNSLILLSFVLSGMGMYLLVYHLLKDRHASLVAGIIFAFSPYHIAHSMDHLTLAQTQWIPFTILYMLKLDENRKKKNAFLFGVFLTLTVFTDAYYALFTVLLVFFYVIYRIYSIGSDRVRILRRGFNAGNVKLGLIIFLIPSIGFFLVYQFLIEPVIVSSTEMVPHRDIYELLVYSAKPWDFFLPPVYHPVFGKYVKEFVLSHLYGSNPIEQVLYVGYVPLALSVYAVYRFWRNRESEEHRTVVLFTLFGLFALSFMPPAYLPIFDLKIPFSLSYLLYQFTQSFRVMARFDVLVMISVAVLAGVSLKHLMQRGRKLVLLSLVVLIILFEYAPIPSNIAEIKRPEQNFPFEQHRYSFHTTIIDVPSVYLWLANQNEDFTIIEYPLVTGASKEEIVHYRYLFYQRVHKKKLVNGASLKIFKEIANLSSPATVERLQEFGVRYVIIHEDLGRFENISSKLEFVKSFGSVSVYEI